MLFPNHARRTLPSVRIGITLLALVATLFTASCDKTLADKKAILTTFEQMKKACEDHDGPGALKVYNQATFDHYDKVVKLGLDGDYGGVLGQPPTTIVEVLGMRTKATRKQLTGLDGKGYVSFAVTAGWWDESLVGLAVKDVKVSGDFATATAHYPEMEKAYKAEKFEQALVGGSRRRRFGGKSEKPPEYPIKFVKEADGWKYDELSMLPHQDRELNEQCNAARVSLRDFMMEICAGDDFEKLPMTIWQPMPKK